MLHGSSFLGDELLWVVWVVYWLLLLLLMRL